MNEIANEVQQQGAATSKGIIFSGTGAEYEAIGRRLLEKLYELEPYVVAAKQRLGDMSAT